jgi:hypothetical protein
MFKRVPTFLRLAAFALIARGWTVFAERAAQRLYGSAGPVNPAQR